LSAEATATSSAEERSYDWRASDANDANEEERKTSDEGE
jgi:hypothetical protein